MPTEQSVTTWVRRLESGDDQAAQRLWDRYFARLVGLARTRLGGVKGHATDEEDVALSAFHSFYRALTKRRFKDLHDREDLWQILVMHVSRKASSVRRHASRAKRGGGNEDADIDDVLDLVLSREPDPQFTALVADQFEWLLNLLEDDDLKAVAIHKLEGHTNDELADCLGISLRSIERKLKVIRGLWDEAVTGETK